MPLATPLLTVIRVNDTFLVLSRWMPPSGALTVPVAVEPVITPPEFAVPSPVTVNDPVLVLTLTSESPREAPVAWTFLRVNVPDELARSTARALVVVTESWLTTKPVLPEATRPALLDAGVM